MQCYPTYDSYRPSKLPWSPEIPLGWQVRKLTHSISYTVGFTPESGNPAFYGDEYLWANISDLGPRQIVSTKRGITKEAVDTYKKKPAKKGSLLYSFKLSVGQVSFAGTKMFTNEAIAAFEESEKIDLSFFYYLAPLAIVQAASENIYGAKILNQEAIGNANLIVPPISEQQAIGRFLDYKTAQIDALIAKKQALLEKLAEKRSALISHAVTKGLDSSVPMHDSGVAWLGEIPAHWQRLLLARVVRRFEQGWSPACEEREAAPDEWGVLKSGCVNYGVFDENEHKTLPSSINPIQALEVNVGDVLMCRASGSKHLIGSVAKVHSCRRKLIFSDKTYRIALDESLIDPDFFVLAMKSKYMRDQIELSISGADGLANNIPQASVKSYQLVLPGVAEQQTIVKSLRIKIDRVVQQESKISAVIAKLKEYRSALITNAVTGKIDVRGVPLPEAVG